MKTFCPELVTGCVRNMKGKREKERQEIKNEGRINIRRKTERKIRKRRWSCCFYRCCFDTTSICILHHHHHHHNHLFIMEFVRLLTRSALTFRSLFNSLPLCLLPLHCFDNTSMPVRFCVTSVCTSISFPYLYLYITSLPLMFWSLPHLYSVDMSLHLYMLNSY
jgi:hypothetical protein